MENIFEGNCTVFLDSTGDLINSSGSIILELLINTDSKLHVINFNKKEISEERIIKGIENCIEKKDIFKEDLLNKLVFEQNLGRNFENILEYCTNCILSNDYIVILGGERLIPYIGTPSVINSKYSKFQISFHTMDNENWIGFAEKIDYLYKELGNKIQGIILFATVYEIYLEDITQAFSAFPELTIASISTNTENNEEYQRIQEEIMKVIANDNFTNALYSVPYVKTKIFSFLVNQIFPIGI